MKRELLIALLFVLNAVVVPLAAMGEEGLDGKFYVCDSSEDLVLCLNDVDASGTIDPAVPGEVVSFYDGSGDGPELSVPSHLAVDSKGHVFLSDGGTLDTILKMKDETGDGDADDPGEALVFYDNSAAGPRLSTPNTIIILPDDTVFVSDDGSGAKHILHLIDLDGDGDALDEGEATVVYDASNESGILIDDPESLAWSAAGSLYVGDSTLQAVYRLTDRDEDGTFLGAGEASLFFQGTDTLSLTDVDALAVRDDGVVYATNEDTGLVIRLEDLDDSGDANGPGEATPFVDASSALRVKDTNDMLLLPDGGLVLADGSKDTIFLAVDSNGDGDALDEGEIVRLLLDDGASLSTPSGICYAASAPIIPTDGAFVRGDSNRDSNLDISDPVATLEYLFLGGGDGRCLDAMDADDSGVVNITDPVFVLNYLFTGGAVMPPPFPEPGEDPTQDPLGCEAPE